MYIGNLDVHSVCEVSLGTHPYRRRTRTPYHCDRELHRAPQAGAALWHKAGEREQHVPQALGARRHGGALEGAWVSRGG